MWKIEGQQVASTYREKLRRVGPLIVIHPKKPSLGIRWVRFTSLFHHLNCEGKTLLKCAQREPKKSPKVNNKL